MTSIDLDTDAKRAGDAIAACLREVEALRQAGVSQEELEKARVNFLANAQGAEQVASDINKDGGKAIAIAADVRDDAAVKALFDKAEDALGSVRVNGVRPGFIATDMHAKGGEPGRVARLAPNIPMRRGGEPHEVAGAIVWLLSDEASFTTGAFIDIGGGI